MQSSRSRVNANLLLFGLFVFTNLSSLSAEELKNTRLPTSQDEQRYWLDNMVRLHDFSVVEVRAATGLGEAEIREKLTQFAIRSDDFPDRPAKLLVVPYPGGRHPRIGFLDGAIDPQRETKISVFTPWAKHDYVVVDVPEAIWSNLGLTYLAHTHIPTIFDKQDIELERLEWSRRDDGALEVTRRLPNGIRFGSHILPAADHVQMELWLTNGTPDELTDLRVQNCVMLKGAAGFAAQNNENKISLPPYAVCHSADSKRWIITGWMPTHRVWFNADCPCLHADPKFPDCPPGETVRLRGWLSFYEGEDIDAEIERIDATGWRKSE